MVVHVQTGLHVVVLVLFLAWLALIVAALVTTVRAPAWTKGEKVGWVIVLCVPLVGLIAWAANWFLSGRRAQRAAASDPDRRDGPV